MSNYNNDHYCMNCQHSFRTENQLKLYRNFCLNHYYCCIKMAKKDFDILKYNQGDKSMKV